MILDALNHQEPPPIDTAAMEHVLETIVANPERVQKVRALVSAILGDDNVFRITAEQFHQLAECTGWLGAASPPPAVGTIYNFIGQTGDQATKSPRIMAAYLYGLHVLKQHSHSCFTPPIPHVLTLTCEPLARFETAIGIPRDGPSDLTASEVLAIGREFYHTMRRGGKGVTGAAFEPLWASALFRDMVPVVNDEQLNSADHLRDVTAIRVGLSGVSYVVSKLSFALFRIEKSRDVPETYLYMRTWMKTQHADRPVIRSHGFLIPRRPHAYLAQYHLEGHGLNVAAISPDELADEFRPFFRGLILAADRETNTGALASKIAFVRTRHPDLVIGDFTREKLQKAIEADRPDIKVDDIIDYLHFAGGISVKPLAEGGPTAGLSELSTWKDLKSYVDRKDVRKRIDALKGPEDTLTGYLHRPMRAD